LFDQRSKIPLKAQPRENIPTKATLFTLDSILKTYFAVFAHKKGNVSKQEKLLNKGNRTSYTQREAK
jgi:hypothetical protein